MRSGNMRELIQLHQPSDSTSKSGAVKHSWTPYLKPIKAELVHETGGLEPTLGEIFADRRLKFNIHKVRETLIIAEGWRIEHHGVFYNVKFVSRFDQRQMLQLEVEKVND